jgi:2-haloacid dehalogenase
MSAKALLFDVFGTCVDWFGSVSSTLSKLADELNPDTDINAITLAWRQAYFDGMSEVRNGNQPWRRVDEIHREALDRLLLEHGLDQLSEPQRIQLNLVWHRLAPWPDTRKGLAMLRKQSYVATLSNGNLDLLMDLQRFGKLQWDNLFCSDLFQHFKPDPETYLGACRLMNLPPEQVMMVASHRSDLAAAESFGLRSAFVRRPTEFGNIIPADSAIQGDFDYVADDFIDLAQQLEQTT